jgi:hypothetical protein
MRNQENIKDRYKVLITGKALLKLPQGNNIQRSL